jgi:hypothetical protein
LGKNSFGAGKNGILQRLTLRHQFHRVKTMPMLRFISLPLRAFAHLTPPLAAQNKGFVHCTEGENVLEVTLGPGNAFELPVFPMGCFAGTVLPG